jgi:hypothetical protein
MNSFKMLWAGTTYKRQIRHELNMTSHLITTCMCWNVQRIFFRQIFLGGFQILTSLEFFSDHFSTKSLRRLWTYVHIYLHQLFVLVQDFKLQGLQVPLTGVCHWPQVFRAKSLYIPMCNFSKIPLFIKLSALYCKCVYEYEE